MQLTHELIAGAGGGFLSTFSSWLVTGTLFHQYQRLTPETWRPEGPRQYVMSTGLQTLEGAAVGALFFATGGLAIMPATTWFARGLAFGALAWLALACPVLLSCAIYIKLHRGVVIGLVLDTLLAVLAMSLASSWAA